MSDDFNSCREVIAQWDVCESTVIGMRRAASSDVGCFPQCSCHVYNFLGSGVDEKDPLEMSVCLEFSMACEGLVLVLVVCS